MATEMANRDKQLPPKDFGYGDAPRADKGKWETYGGGGAFWIEYAAAGGDPVFHIYGQVNGKDEHIFTIDANDAKSLSDWLRTPYREVTLDGNL